MLTLIAIVSPPRRRGPITPSLSLDRAVWVPAFAGTTPNFWHSSALPVLVSARDTPSSLCLRHVPKGTERRTAQRLGSRLLRRRASGERLAPTGAPSAAISVSEPRFLGRGLAGMARGGGFALSQSSESSSRTGPSARRAESQSLPGACLRGTPAGAASTMGFRPLVSGAWRSCRRLSPDGPALTTPHEDALRRTGRIAYSPS
jgi:hypothetical protein